MKRKKGVPGEEFGGLPDDDPVKRATDAAAQGFAPGIVSPTMILLDRHNLRCESCGLRSTL